MTTPLTPEEEWVAAFDVALDPGTVGYDLQSLYSATAWQVMTLAPECGWRDRALAHLLESRAEIMQVATVAEPSTHADPWPGDCDEPDDAPEVPDEDESA